MLDEADYLALQATRAKAGFRRTAATLADEILAPLQIRPLIRHRPWWSLGGATVAGLACGLVLGRRRKPAANAAGKVDGLLASASRRVGRVLKSVLGAMVVANLRGSAAAAPAPPTNGHAAMPSPQPDWHEAEA